MFGLNIREIGLIFSLVNHRLKVERKIVLAAETDQLQPFGTTSVAQFLKQRHAIDMDDERGQAGVSDDMDQFVHSKAAVDADTDSADLEATEEMLVNFDEFASQHADRITLARTERLKRGGDPVRAGIHLAPAARNISGNIGRVPGKVAATARDLVARQSVVPGCPGSGGS